MIIRITSVNIFNITRKIMRKIYTKTFVYFAEIQYIYNEINNRNIIMDILNFTYYFLIYNLIFNSNQQLNCCDL